MQAPQFKASGAQARETSSRKIFAWPLVSGGNLFLLTWFSATPSNAINVFLCHCSGFWPVTCVARYCTIQNGVAVTHCTVFDPDDDGRKVWSPLLENGRLQERPGPFLISLQHGLESISKSNLLLIFCNRQTRVSLHCRAKEWPAQCPFRAASVETRRLKISNLFWLGICRKYLVWTFLSCLLVFGCFGLKLRALWVVRGTIRTCRTVKHFDFSMRSVLYYWSFKRCYRMLILLVFRWYYLRYCLFAV